MKVVMFSMDRLVFDERSAVRERMRDLGSVFEELSVIIPTPDTSSFRETKLSHNVTLHPTRSRGRIGMLFGAYRIGSSLIKGRQGIVLTSQDPFFLGLLTYLLGRRFKVPFQLQVHVDFLSSSFATSFRRQLERLIALFILPRSGCVRVVSKRIAESLLRRGIIPEYKLTVLPVFIHRPPERPFSSARRVRKSFRVLISSRLEEEKDIPLGIRAFAGVVRDVPNAELLIAGSGSKRDELENLVESLGLEEHVTFLGWQEPDRLSAYFSRADVFLNTSRYEGYARTLIEAALAGLPIVTTDVGIAGEILGEHEALICPVGDEQCVRKMLLELASDASLRKSIGAAAKAAAQKSVFGDKRAYLQALYNSFTPCLDKPNASQ